MGCCSTWRRPVARGAVAAGAPNTSPPPSRKNSPPPKEGYLPHPPPERLQKEARSQRMRMIPVTFMHPPGRHSSWVGQRLPSSKSLQRADREGLDRLRSLLKALTPLPNDTAYQREPYRSTARSCCKKLGANNRHQAMPLGCSALGRLI
jgi:hypothetical protein